MLNRTYLTSCTLHVLCYSCCRPSAYERLDGASFVPISPTPSRQELLPSEMFSSSCRLKAELCRAFLLGRFMDLTGFVSTIRQMFQHREVEAELCYWGHNQLGRHVLQTTIPLGMWLQFNTIKKIRILKTQSGLSLFMTSFRLGISHLGQWKSSKALKISVLWYSLQICNGN